MPTLSAKRPLTIFVCVILVITLGVISFTKMPTTLLPEFELPYVVVYATYPGAGAEKVEAALTKPLEGALSSTGGLENISSISSDNLSLIIMQFAYSTNMDSALIEMNGNIDLIKGYLDDAVSSPTLMRIDPDMLPVIVAAVSVDGLDAVGTSDYVEETVEPALERVDGVADVSATGLVSSTVRVTFDENKLDALQQKFDDSVRDGFADGYKQLEDSQEEITSGADELTDAEKTLSDSRAKADREFAAKAKELKSARAQIEDGIAQIDEGLAAIDAGYAPESQRAELEAQKTALEDKLKDVEAGEAALKQAKKETYAKLDDAAAQLEDSKTQLDDAKTQLEDGRKELDDALEAALDAVDVRSMITQSMLSGIITAGNISFPAGYVVEDGEKLSVKVGAEFASLDEISDLMLFDSGDVAGEVHVSDIATVELTDDSGENYAKINGQDGILVTVNKQSSAGTTTVSSDVRTAIDKLEANGDGVNVTVLSDQGVYIEIVVKSVIENLLIGAVLAILILLLFLRSARPTFIVAVSIPVSLLLAVTLMYFFDISLNLISLCGLAMGVGMLVDNSIVVIENIYRLRAEGMSTLQAAVRGAKEVAGAITASTLTTVCVFLPIVFTEGLSKELFMDMGLTIAFALIASLIVAMTFVPAAGSMLLERGAKKETKVYEAFVNAYERALRFTLRHKAYIIIIVVALLGVSVYGAFTAGTAFLPKSDSLQLIISASVDDGYSQDDARSLMDETAQRILSVEGVSDVGIMSGGMSFSSAMGSGSGGSYSIYAVLDENRSVTSMEISREIEAKTADLPCEISIVSGSMDISSLMESGISIDIEGDDLDELRTCARDIADIAASVEGVASVNDGIGETTPEYVITVDKQAAMSYSLTTAQVYSAVSTALTGETTATSVTVGGTDADIVVAAAEDAAYTRDTLSDLMIEGKNSDGESVKVRLGDIASFSVGESQRSIKHDQGTRTLSVTAAVDSEHNIGLVSRQLESALAAYDLPDGYTMQISGESATINDTLSDLIDMALLALLLIYLIMVAQFQSLLSPFIVMFTIPLAFTGGLLLQWACGFEVSVISMLGLLVLFGVVVNNGIVFVDCANGIYAETGDKRESLVAAGRRRMRPILMTTLTTVLALVTMCFGLGTGADLLQPMAVVLVGGLVYGTLLTLFIVPVFYDLLRRKPPRVVKVDE